MDWLASNWYQILTIIVLVAGGLIQYGVFKSKMTSLCDKVEKMETSLGEAVTALNAHCSNPDIHVNQVLLKLFDERFESAKTAQINTRADISRIENLLLKM